MPPSPAHPHLFDCCAPLKLWTGRGLARESRGSGPGYPLKSGDSKRAEFGNRSAGQGATNGLRVDPTGLTNNLMEYVQGLFWPAYLLKGSLESSAEIVSGLKVHNYLAPSQRRKA
jgi:hypothetical protein